MKATRTYFPFSPFLPVRLAAWQRGAQRFSIALIPLAALVICAVAAAPAPPAKTKKSAPPNAVAPAGKADKTKADQKTASFEKEILPVVHQYCTGCHGASSPAGGISLVGYKNAASVVAAHDVWEKVATTVSAGHMPPPGMPQPPAADRVKVATWIESTLAKAACALQDPGRVTMRRLNREEYNNTVRDLFGVDIRPAADFPSDDVGYGFDNIGDVLSISPLLMEKYLSAAEKVSQAVIVTPEMLQQPTDYRGEKLANAGGGSFDETDGRLLSSEGQITVEHDFVQTGEYVIRVEASGQQAGPDPCRMSVRLDDQDVKTVLVESKPPKFTNVEIRQKVFAGKHKIAAAFLNDYYNTDSPNPKLRGDRNLIINSIRVEGPIGANVVPTEVPAAHRRLIPKRPAPGQEVAAARKIFGTLARRAYRRTVSDAEVERLAQGVVLAKKQGQSFEWGIQIGIQAMLMSPNFLFRVEIDPDPGNPKAKRELNGFEMATRLAYFLWSSAPDETLLTLAEQGKLKQPAVLRTQVRRMLQDPKARALATNFAGQWLQLRRLDDVSPDPATFPDWNDDLRWAMRRESEMFFSAIAQEDRSILELIDAKFTFLNEALARHYGNTEVRGAEFRKVALSGGQRGGVLTQAAVLTVTSNPTRTSPVKRGKWVLEQILGTPPPPPPPGVPQLPDDQQEHQALTGTLRQRLEEHRKNPACASCHRLMDGIGFGLENYDAVGGWRAKDGEAAIDASGELADGRKFNGAGELKKILLQDKKKFARSFTERLLTYAIGRGIEPYDKCNLDEMAERIAGNDYKFSSVIEAIVTSDPFRMRRGDGTILRTAKQAH